MTEDKKPKQRHRLLVNPTELGLTARIKKALIEQDMGITQRIQKAFAKTKDETSFFYMRKNHFVMVGTLLFLVILFGLLAFRTRDLRLTMKYPDGKEVAANLNLAFYHFSKYMEIPAYARQILFERFDIYGNDLGDKDFVITAKNDQKVDDPRNLMPGVYTLHIKKEGFKEVKIPLHVGDVRVRIPVALEPLIEPKRDLKLYLNDPLIEGQQDVEPDDVRIVGSNKSIKNVQIKSGKYAVIIEKSGYHPKETEIMIPENGIIAEKITLDYRKRAIKMLVDDGLYEKNYEPLVNPKEISLVQEGKQVPFKDVLMPGYYDIEINRDGYELFKERMKIPAGGDMLTLRIPLKPKDREVAVAPNYDIAPSELKPDKSYLKDLQSTAKEVIPITDGLKVKPGWYWAMVEKANYHSFGKKIFIEPGNKPYEVKAHLISVSKILLLKIRSDFDVEPSLNPDELMVDMKIAKTGYVSLEWGKLKQGLAPEKKEIEVPVFLETIPVRIVSEITSDIVTGPIRPDIGTLTRILEGKPAEQSIDIKAEAVAKPGRYLLTLKKTGYDDIQEEIIIFPSDRAYVVRKEMKARRVPLVIKIDSDYEPGKEIRPDDIKINNEPGKFRNELKPGAYTVYVQKNGFHPIEKRVKIDPSGEEYIFAEQFRAKPRRVIFDIRGGDDYGKLIPDVVTFDGNTIKENTEIPPKKDGYEVKIQVKGFAMAKKSIVVEPAEEPFILREQMTVLKRKVSFSVTATYPKGKDLMPLDQCNLGTLAVVGAEAEVKPGEYKLEITKSSYKPISRTIKIEPDEAVFQVKELMEPKDREIRIELSYDVEPENPKLDKLIRLLRKDGGFDKYVKEGDMIAPNNYRLEITVSGFKKLEQDIEIPPSESTFISKHTLESEPRPVIIKVTAEYPPGKEINPDNIMMNGTPFAELVKQGGKMKPGQYSLVIDKAGYHSIKKQVFIPAGTENFEIKEQMITTPRLVKYQLSDAETKRELIPDKINLGAQPITQDSSFKPGKYRLDIRIQGYSEISEDLEIEPGVEPYVIRRAILASSRPVQYEIKGDYVLENLSADKFNEISLNGKSLKEHTAFAPGPYELVVYAPGYERMVKRIDIGPSRDPFIIREEVKSKKRKVIFDITSPFTGSVKLKPDRVVFDNKDTMDGEEVKPKAGGYQVAIEKAGYVTVSNNFVIEPSESNYELKVVLQTRPRNILFEFDSDYKGGPISADTIKIDGKDYQGGDTVLPGEHSFEIIKAGYEKFEFKENIDPGVEPFKVKKTLVTKSRQFKPTIISDYTNNPMDPLDTCTLGEKNIKTEVFKPGVYELVVGQSGYHGVREKVEIVPGEGPQEYTKTLVAKKRKIKPNIQFDRDPTPDMPAHVIRMSSPSTAAMRVQEEDELPPGEYRITIEKEGYETFHSRWVIDPSDQPAVRDFVMVSKMVEILIDITYDIEPPKDIAPFTVTFVEAQSGIPRLVAHGKRIKPGPYLLQVSRPGYIFKTPNKKITVLPGEKPFLVKEQLYAKPRNLSFEMMFQTIMVKPIEIFIDGKQVKAEDTFNPGQEYKLMAKFLEYKTAQKNVVIPPGEAPYVVDMTLVRLQKYEFSLAKRFIDVGKGMMADGIRYTLEVYTDGEQVEPHQIVIDEQSRGFSMVYANFYASTQARAMRIVCGFYFDDSLVKKQLTFRDLGKIDGNRLLDHIRELAKTTPEKTLTCLSRLMRDKEDKIKIGALPKEDREKVANVLRDLDLPDAQQQELRNTIIKRLQQN